MMECDLPNCTGVYVVMNQLSYVKLLEFFPRLRNTRSKSLYAPSVKVALIM